jgi:hypothetical protein
VWPAPADPDRSALPVSHRPRTVAALIASDSFHLYHYGRTSVSGGQASGPSGSLALLLIFAGHPRAFPAVHQLPPITSPPRALDH